MERLDRLDKGHDNLVDAAVLEGELLDHLLQSRPVLTRHIILNFPENLKEVVKEPGHRHLDLFDLDSSDVENPPGRREEGL
ncbi:MAG: hypothetical protein BWY86_01314 [Candidatus Aminicenantes bacterium ADurb.Bin508]|nr:MAG: hypothetical protein BWY86_01314 [Candidatus Aminicenantes bacterium ADurb.Bin508]